MVIADIILALFLITFPIALCICLNGIRKSTVMLKRNNEVYAFRQQLLHLASAYSIRRIREGIFTREDDALTWFLNKYTYEEMLNSNKPLTLEEWYTEEEIKRVKS